jgi:hypothetical protein
LFIPNLQYVEDKLRALARLLVSGRRSWLKRRYDQVSEAQRQPRLVSYLASRYSEYELLSRCGKVYPVAVLAREVRPLEMRDRIVCRPVAWHWPDGRFVISDRTLRKLRTRLGAPVDPKGTYRSVQVRNSPAGPVIDCDIGRYDLMLDTCDSLEWELDQVLSQHPDWDALSPRLEAKLKLRNELHRQIGDPVTDGGGRSVAVAVSVLTTSSTETCSTRGSADDRRRVWRLMRD